MSAVKLLRESFRNDGAEGESVHLVLDEFQAMQDEYNAWISGLEWPIPAGLKAEVERLRSELAHAYQNERACVVAFLMARSLVCVAHQQKVTDDYSKTVHAAQSIAHHDDATAIERAEHWKEPTS